MAEFTDTRLRDEPDTMFDSISALDRKREIHQLARDLLLTVVRRGDQAVDPAAIYDVARRFVEAGEAE